LGVGRGADNPPRENPSNIRYFHYQNINCISIFARYWIITYLKCKISEKAVTKNEEVLEERIKHF
jgi:hypothetical protein